MTGSVSPARRRSVLAALRRGTVPDSGLDLLAVGLDRLAPAFDAELAACRTGAAAFTAIRGEYGSGKTFVARWLGERAKGRGIATAEVQISETETPLHRLETVYRRLCEQLATATDAPSAFRPVLDSWLYALEEDVLAEGVRVARRRRRARPGRRHAPGTTPRGARANHPRLRGRPARLPAGAR